MEALVVVGTLFSVASTLQQGKQQQMQYQAQADAAAYDAAVKRQRAETIRQVYGQREEQSRRESRLEAGRRLAAIAESNTGFGGSNLDIHTQSEVFAELDALNIRYEGELQSKGLLDAASLDDFYGGINRDNASYARSNSYLGAGAAVLSGAADYNRITARRSPARPTMSGPYAVTPGSDLYGIG